MYKSTWLKQFLYTVKLLLWWKYIIKAPATKYHWAVTLPVEYEYCYWNKWSVRYAFVKIKFDYRLGLTGHKLLNFHRRQINPVSLTLVYYKSVGIQNPPSIYRSKSDPFTVLNDGALLNKKKRFLLELHAAQVAVELFKLLCPQPPRPIHIFQT